MIPVNIHGLLAERTRSRVRVNWLSKETGNGSAINFWRKDGIVSVHARGASGEPGVSVRRVKTAEMLDLTLVSGSSYESTHDSGIDLSRSVFLRLVNG
jgi:hypothetical protein